MGILFVFVGEVLVNFMKDEFVYEKGGYKVLVLEFILFLGYCLIFFFIVLSVCFILVVIVLSMFVWDRLRIRGNGYYKD